MQRLTNPECRRVARLACTDAGDDETPCRMFLCARCRRQALVCRRCDRGQIYCAGTCAQEARREARASLAEAAKVGGMDRQTLRDWVIRFNAQGPEGLINLPSPGAPSKLDDVHLAFLARIVEEGPIPAIHGVVRWRACDLIMRLHEEFGISVSDDTVYRALKDLGYSHVSARPRAYKQDAEAVEVFKKTLPGAWQKSAPNSLRGRPSRSGSRTR